MGKPTVNNCVEVIRHNEFAIMLSRVGKGPLVQVWVNEIDNGGRGIILDVEQSDKFIESWQNLLDEIEGEVSPA